MEKPWENPTFLLHITTYLSINILIIAQRYTTGVHSFPETVTVSHYTEPHAKLTQFIDIGLPSCE